MVFSSLPFLFAFLPIALGGYFLLPRRARNAWLFGVSLVFYAWGEPVYVALMLFSTVVDYTLGRGVARWRGRPGARVMVALSVIVNLSLLGFFKYADFLLSGVNVLLGVQVRALNLPLPIGISFYTFQTMSYTLDVYRGDAPVQRNFIAFGAYVSLFPQLIAGPIVRYHEVAEQLTCRRETWAGVEAGSRRFIRGLVKKVLLANFVGPYWEMIQAMGQWSLLSGALGVMCFALQIYFDFSGYSDMAIGLGRIFGFTFPENFRHPYLAQSASEFWRRWHITLGAWFREYLYIPLGGNRRGVARTILNLAVVWLATGLWHGAVVNFLLWGGYFGLLIILERFVWGRALSGAPRALRHLYTLAAVAVGWVIFCFPTLGQIGAYLGGLIGLGGLADRTGWYVLDSLRLMLPVMALLATPWPGRWARHLTGRPWGRALVSGLYAAGLLLCVASLVNGAYNPFLYFRF